MLLEKHYDKIMGINAIGTHQPDLLNIARFDVSRIAVASLLAESELEWTWTAFPRLVPPYAHCWMEYTFPKSTPGGQPIPAVHQGLDGLGFMVSCEQVTPDDPIESGEIIRIIEAAEKALVQHTQYYAGETYLMRSRWGWRDAYDLERKVRRDEIEVGWVVHGQLMLFKADGVFTMLAWPGYLDKAGRPINSFPMILGIMDDLGEGEAAQAEADRRANLIPSLAFPFWQGIAMLHAKNVTIKEETVYRKGRRLRQDRGPKYVVKKLRVTSSKVVYKNALGVAAATKRKRHHVMGHFRDYTENPLFGREANRGIFWISEHERGDKSIGSVDKEYDLGD